MRAVRGAEVVFFHAAAVMVEGYGSQERSSSKMGRILAEPNRFSRRASGKVVPHVVYLSSIAVYWAWISRGERIDEAYALGRID